MAASRMFTLANAIRVMLLGGLVALVFVIVQSCQVPKSGLDRFAVKSLRKLTVLPGPPSQPTMTFDLPDGATAQLSDYRDKVILVNAWATWCPPCVAEMPTLDDLQKLRRGPKFEVVTISIDRTLEDAQLWFEDNNIENLPIMHDGTYSLPQRLDMPGLPVSIFYDRQGREIARLPGEADWTSSEALALIDAVIGK